MEREGVIGIEETVPEWLPLTPPPLRGEWGEIVARSTEKEVEWWLVAG